MSDDDSSDDSSEEEVMVVEPSPTKASKQQPKKRKKQSHFISLQNAEVAMSRPIDEAAVKAKELAVVLHGEDGIDEIVDAIDGKAYLRFTCPKCGRACGKLLVLKGTGYSNVLRKMKTCFGSEAKVRAAYKEVLKTTRAGASKEVVKRAMIDAVGYTPEENALYDWLVLIIENNLPLTAVRNSNYKTFSRHNISISYERIVEMLFALEEIVMEIIKKEMKGKKGCILHDGWTQSGVHYMGVYGTYMVVDKETGKQRLRIPLLGCHPMFKFKGNAADVDDGLVDSDDDDSDEDIVLNDLVPAEDAFIEEGYTSPGYSPEFNAATMQHHLDSVFQSFGFNNAREFALGQVADSTAVNTRLAKDMRIPHFPCHNHEFALDLNDDEKRNKTTASQILFMVRKIIRSIRVSTKNMAVLYNITSRRPKATDTCKWKERPETLIRFSQSFSAIRHASDSKECPFRLPSSVDAQFMRDCDKHASEYGDIRTVIASLEEHGLVREHGQALLDGFFDIMDDESTKTGNMKFHGNSFKQNHSKIGSKHEVDHNANSGIIKVQRGEDAHLTPDEKHALKRFRAKYHDSDDDNDDDDGDSEKEVDLREALYAKINQTKNSRKRRGSRYIDCSFVLSSSALVERLWSKADAILDQRRRALSPLIVETLLFLKENRHYWNQAHVAEALTAVKKNGRSERLKKKMELEEVSNKINNLAM